jgi:uncharacterized protein YbjT (DUF2867 family)
MKAVLAGATGLVGGFLLETLVQDGSFTKIIAPARRVLSRKSIRLENPVIDFNDPAALENSFDNTDIIFSAVGTTRKKVNGDEKAYRKVDADIPVTLARAGLEKGASCFVLVSSIGADPGSGNFYLRLKGEVEQTIISLGYRRVYILRPSLLLGPRDEFRLVEFLGSGIMRLMATFLFGSYRKYHPVEARQVAKAMAEVAKDNTDGVHFLYYDDMIKFK